MNRRKFFGMLLGAPLAALVQPEASEEEWESLGQASATDEELEKAAGCDTSEQN